MGFVMQNLQILGLGGGDYPFLVDSLKRHILGRFRAFWAIGRLGSSAGFASRRKKERHKKSQSGYI